MPIHFTCPHCGNKTFVADQYIGQSGPCLKCGQTITVAPVGGAPAARTSSGGGAAVAVVVCIGLGLLFLCVGVLLVGLAFMARSTVVAVPSAQAQAERDDVTMVADDSAEHEGFNVVRLQPHQGGLAELLKAEAAKAKERGRRPYVEFDTPYYQPSRDIKASLSDPRMIDAYQGTYIIRLEVNSWSGAVEPLGFRPHPYPSWEELDDDGRPNGRRLDANAWGPNVPENMAGPLKEYFQAPRPGLEPGTPPAAPATPDGNPTPAVEPAKL